MKKFLTVTLLLTILVCNGQDTLKVMQYNLLNFGNFTDYCTFGNNDPDDKTEWLKTIVDFYLPDVLAVNEIGTSATWHNQILTDVLNTSGRNYFERSAATNFAGSNIINMLYYNADKLVLDDQDVIEHYLRDINVYKLYHKQQPTSNVDTAFFYLIVTHLKSGTSGDNKNTRAEMTQAIRDYVEVNNISDACLVTGDFNIRSSSEQSWQNLTNGILTNFNFSDPTGMEGSWHTNSNFTNVHTQSTHSTSNGCAAGGGMDDRFDFILINQALSSQENPVRYVDGSYHTPGQDGQRLDGSLINPPNTSAPAAIINAMYGMSDHLPVIVDLIVDIESEVLPSSWDFIPTSSSHIIVVPLLVNPLINGTPLLPGDYAGVFYLDQGIEKCAGNTLWSATENMAIIAFGDDVTTVEKEGFAEGDPIIFKIYSNQSETAYYADVDFDDSWNNDDGVFVTGGISALTKLDAYYLQVHQVMIKEGWSGISSFLVPKWKPLENVFGSNLADVIFISDGVRIYYPQGGIEELNFWDKKAALTIKSSAEFILDIEGVPDNNTSIFLSAGWNIIPVSVPCYVQVSVIDQALGGKLEIIKSIAGTQVYWPGNEIFSLSQLSPGSAYLIKVTEDCSFDFECY